MNRLLIPVTAEGDVTVFNAFKKNLLDKVMDLGSSGDTVKVILVAGGYTPDIDNDTVYLDVDQYEYTTNNGYTNTGHALSSLATSQDNTDDEGVWDAGDLTISSVGPLSGGTPQPAYAILYDDTPTSPADPLICAIELGSTQPNGGDYTFTFNSEGIINLT